MFQGTFLEGQLEPTSKNPPTLSLPEGESEAILLFCHILQSDVRLRSATIVEPLQDLIALHDLATLCDKKSGNAFSQDLVYSPPEFIYQQRPTEHQRGGIEERENRRRAYREACLPHECT
jgi:hypothetical protein